jgi:hypothetical protein
MNSILRTYAHAACAAALGVAAPLHAQDTTTTRTVSGVVSDSGGRPVPYVSIDGGPTFRTLSNASGEFTMIVPKKQALNVDVRRIGFLPGKFKVTPGSDTTISIAIQQLGVLLTTQVIRAQQQLRTLENRGFYSRMLESQRGALVGDYVTPEEIEMRSPQRTTQLLDQKRGIRVKRFGNCYIVDECYRVFGPGDCVATVYLDGRRLNNLANMSVPVIDQLVQVTAVAGIEVYPRGSSAPPQFQALSGTCSIVVIWTK